MWYNSGVHPTKAFDRIIMRLDEYSSGGVTPYNLARALQMKSLREFVNEYVREDDHSVSKPRITNPDIRLPLLMWIDDNIENISYDIERAQEMGVHVIHLTSTAIAKAWIEENHGFLKANDKGSHIRIISDNVRLESMASNGPYLNPFAGQNILRFMRGRLLAAPVLIYAGLSIRSTGFVTEFTAASSTSDQRVCQQYISSLAARVDDDNGRQGFDKVHSSWS